MSPLKSSADKEPTKRRFSRQIHLLYVPTLYCNLACSYCYLSGQTGRNTLKQDAARAADTLQQGLDRFMDAGVLPFNVSLHGGEVTTLPPSTLDQLFGIIQRHYLHNFDELNALGHRKSTPHIKTNLFNFHKLYDLFERNRVSISASIDLPLFMHERHRLDRRGRPWLKQAVENLRLLARYPHSKKISATLYQEHLEDIPALIADIKMIHRQLGFDMNNFNIMFGFGSGRGGLRQASEELQVKLYHALTDAFIGTDLEDGLLRNWFDEFKPSYCTNAFNCGERFYLLQGDGSVWSCVRGQGVEQTCYGNLLTDPVEQILENGRRRISLLHQQQGFDPDCQSCRYLHLCHTGCPVVKLQNRSAKSYTCLLQQAIYQDNPASWPKLNDVQQQAACREYLLGQHPLLAQEDSSGSVSAMPATVLPAELYDQKNRLLELIAQDSLLRQLYSEEAFILSLNGELIPLKSQILTPQRTLYTVGPEDRVVLHLRKSILEANCQELVRNTLYIQMLRDTAVVYGDEQRTKQEHLFTHQIFFNLLEEGSTLGSGFLTADLGDLLAIHGRHFIKGVLNNLFVTTGQLREYHYQKQKNNAFYHIQAINLPFQNFEFYWDSQGRGAD